MDIRERYKHHYGVVAGYLPPNIDDLVHWHRQMAAELGEAEKDGPPEDHPSVAALRKLVDTDPEISSTSFTRDPHKNPDVEKGDEPGYFSYGGSTLALVFRKKATRKFNWQWPPEDLKQQIRINVRSQIATAN